MPPPARTGAQHFQACAVVALASSTVGDDAVLAFLVCAVVGAMNAKVRAVAVVCAFDEVRPRMDLREDCLGATVGIRRVAVVA